MKRFCNRTAVLYLGRIVEIAESESLYRRAAAPLFPGADQRDPRGQPRWAPRGCPSAGLEGDVPSPISPPTGCPLPHPLPAPHARVLRADPGAQGSQARPPGPPASCTERGPGRQARTARMRRARSAEASEWNERPPLRETKKFAPAPHSGPRDRIDVGLVRNTRGAISVQDS